MDQDFISNFEEKLNLDDVSKSGISARVLGYGEISCIFEINGDSSRAFKRMPMFENVQEANAYVRIYEDYKELLTRAGILLPEDELAIVEVSNGPVVLYISQEQFRSTHFVNKLINQLGNREIQVLFNKIIDAIEGIWHFNLQQKNELELAIDGQLSNWVYADDQLYYIDTSTPLFKKKGKEQLDPELLLKSTPGFLRWIIRAFFLKGVMNRYYDRRSVYIDLVANLYKEQRADLIPMILGLINSLQDFKENEMTELEVRDYYTEDKRIWSLFLMFRKIDRWITKKIFRKKYHFLLPGPIKR